MTDRYIAPATASPAGSDSTGTGLIGAPWASISKWKATAAVGDRLFCRGGTYGQTGNQGIAINIANTTIVAYTGETPRFSVSRSTIGLQPAAAGVTIDGLTLVGPGANIYGNSFGIYSTGSFANLSVINCTITDFDQSGIYLYAPSGQANTVIDNNTIARCTYAGIIASGIVGGSIQGNDVRNIGTNYPGSGSPNWNAYGIAVTMDYGGTPSSDVLVQDNYIDYVPLWHGLDTHGGVRVDFIHNEVRHCARGIFLTDQTDLTEHATDCETSYNLVTNPQTAVNGTDANTAITTYDTRTNEIHHNVIGSAYPNITYDSGGLSTGLNIHDNSRGETLPTLPGEPPPPPVGGSTYDTAVVADAASFFPLLAEVSGHLVDSVGSLTSTGEGGITYRAAGPLATGSVNNYGVTLSGSSSFIDWNDANALDLGNTFSIELLIKRSSNGLQAILDKGNTGGTGYSLWFTASNFLRLSLGLAGTEITTSTASITNTAWHHVVATKSGATVAIYIDGVEGHSGGTPSTTMTDTTSGLTVGSFRDSSAFLAATITRVATYKVALSGATVSAHYAAISAAVGISAIPTAAALIINPGTPVVSLVSAPLANPTPATLTLTGATPTVSTGGSKVAVPGAANLVLSGGFPAVAVSGGSLALVIAGTNRIGVLKAGTLRTKSGPSGSQGVADFTLIDFTPADNDTVVIRQGVTTYYSGFVRSRSTTELKTPGHWYCQVGCQDDIPFVNSLGPAPFAFSDTPNNSTSFGYESAALQSTSARGVSYVDTTTSLAVRARRAGIVPGHTVTVTSANNGLSAVPLFCNSVEIAWPTNTPVYTYALGDPVVTLTDTIIYNVGHPDSETAAALATLLHTPKVFTVLPPLPDPAYPIGTIGYLTTDGKIYRVTPDGLLWTNVVDGTDILVASITAGVIAAGAIGAEALAAELVLASKLVTPALTGARLELDQAGLRAYDSSGAQGVNVPTDGSPVQVTGQLTASTLTATGSAEFDGTNLFAKNSVSTLASGVMPPNSAPVLAAGWASHDLEPPPTPTGYTQVVGNGYWDTAGGASGATTCYVAIGRLTYFAPGYPPTYVVYEWRTSDWLIDRMTTLTGLTLGPNSHFNGITRIGTSWYIAGDDSHTGFGTSRVTKVTRTTGVQSATATRASVTYYDIATDGTLLYMPTLPLPGQPAVETWTTSPAFSSVKSLILPPPGNPVGIESMSGNWWVVFRATAGGSYRAYPFVPSTGAIIINRDFPVVGRVDGRAGIVWDGTVFRSSAGDGVETFSVADHTVWDWTTASAKYWVGYSWYDSAGTTHETSVGPRSSITMGRRQRLQVSTPAVPVGGADDPDNARIYMVPSATTPSAGAFKLQVADALTTRYLTTYTVGAADGTGTAFPGVAGAKLASTDTSGWALWGDGTATMPTDKYTESTTFTISGGGTATYTGKVARWSRLGNLVTWRLSFTVNAGGSGASTITVTNPGWPTPAVATTIAGYRAVANQRGFAVLLSGSSGDVLQIAGLADDAVVVGTSLLTTQQYLFSGSYYAD